MGEYLPRFGDWAVVVPFGRYKGKPIEQMLADSQYVRKQIQSEAVSELYPEFVGLLRSRLGLINEKAEVSDQSTTRLSHEKPAPRPSRHRLRTAYHWLAGIDMASRRNRLLTPPPACRFLVDWLSPKKRQEYQTHGGLNWRDWHACHLELARRMASPGRPPGTRR